MSVLIVGGAGYVGSHTVDWLCNKGYDVVVIDNLSTGHKKSLNKDAKFYEGDLRDKAFMRSVFDKESIDGVIHCAAFSIVPESMKEPLKYYDNNTYGMNVLLEIMNEYKVKFIVFSSTAATYGEPKQIPIKESDPQIPTNPYGETKLAMEKMMHWADVAYDMKFIALRYFNVGGAKEDGSIGEDHNPETHLTPIVLDVAHGIREELTIFGDDYDTPDGTNVRDYVHVLDLAEAHRLALEHLLAGNESNAFNLGSSTGFSNLQIVEAAKEVTGKDIPTKIGARRPGDPSTLIADSTKARTVLNWKPQHDDIKKIIQDAWTWETKNPKGYDDK